MKTINKHKHVGRGVVAKGQENIKSHVVDMKNQPVFVKQDFKVVDDRILDAKGRITISHDWMPYKNQSIRSFKIYRNGDGDLLLRPEVSVPAREAWIFQNPEVLASIRRGIQDAKEGKGDIVDDVDAYLENL